MNGFKTHWIVGTIVVVGSFKFEAGADKKFDPKPVGIPEDKTDGGGNSAFILV